MEDDPIQAAIAAREARIRSAAAAAAQAHPVAGGTYMIPDDAPAPRGPQAGFALPDPKPTPSPREVNPLAAVLSVYDDDGDSDETETAQETVTAAPPSPSPQKVAPKPAAPLDEQLASFFTELNHSGLLDDGSGPDPAAPAQDAAAVAGPADEPGGTQKVLGDAEGAEGWQQVLDESSGSVYFWHAGTNEVAWEAPTSTPAAPSPSPAPRTAEVDPEASDPAPTPRRKGISEEALSREMEALSRRANEAVGAALAQLPEAVRTAVEVKVRARDWALLSEAERHSKDPGSTAWQSYVAHTRCRLDKLSAALSGSVDPGPREGEHARGRPQASAPSATTPATPAAGTSPYYKSAAVRYGPDRQPPAVEEDVTPAKRAAPPAQSEECSDARRKKKKRVERGTHSAQDALINKWQTARAQYTNL